MSQWRQSVRWGGVYAGSTVFMLLPWTTMFVNFNYIPPEALPYDILLAFLTFACARHMLETSANLAKDSKPLIEIVQHLIWIARMSAKNFVEMLGTSILVMVLDSIIQCAVRRSPFRGRFVTVNMRGIATQEIGVLLLAFWLWYTAGLRFNQKYLNELLLFISIHLCSVNGMKLVTVIVFFSLWTISYINRGECASFSVLPVNDWT